MVKILKGNSECPSQNEVEHQSGLQDAAQTPIGVTNVRERAWLTHFIQRPDEVLAAKDLIAPPLFSKHKQVQMPNPRLGAEYVKILIDYLQQSAGRDAMKESSSRK